MAPKKWIYDEVGKSQEYMSNLVWEFISWSRRADARWSDDADSIYKYLKTAFRFTNDVEMPGMVSVLKIVVRFPGCPDGVMTETPFAILTLRIPITTCK